MNSTERLSNRNRIGDQQMAINLRSDFINQYGQLIGEYSRLDDELWFSKPEEDDNYHADDAVVGTEEGLESNFASSYEYTAEQMELSKCIDNRVSEGGGTTNVKEKATNPVETESGSTCFTTTKPVRMRKVCDLLKSGGVDKEVNETVILESRICENFEEHNLHVKSISKKKKQKVGVKKCTHCESTRTPQWREGPMGHATLCNACGVQYRHGRLFPEYRPIKSPTFNAALHSHLPKQVQHLRMARNGKISEDRDYQK